MANTERKRTSADKGSTGSERHRVKSAARAGATTGTNGDEKRRAQKKKPAARLPADVAKAIAAARDKKAVDLVVLDLRHTPAFTDFFVLCSGTSQRQVKAIADAVEAALKAANLRPAHTEGYERAEWVLMDFFTFIVHVFTPQTRAFYSLERLWGDAERIEVSAESATGPNRT